MTSSTHASPRLAAEWEPHAATWIAWPHERDDWPGKFGPIAWVYVEIVRLLSHHEHIQILVNDRDAKRSALKKLKAGGARLENISFQRIPTDRVWTRDTGPMFVSARSETGSDAQADHAVAWRFNGWAKYRNHLSDERVAQRIAKAAGYACVKPRIEIEGKIRRIVLEGGAIDVDGRGTLITTEECLLSPIQERNQGVGKVDYEAIFAAELGIDRVIWLNQGIAGDDTHGHVDDIARFVAPHTIIAAVESDPTDPNHDPLNENLDRLRRARDRDGNPYKIATLPMPRPVVFDGQTLPASYANFYIANGLVLVPTFNDPADREALQTIALLFPDREVVGVFARDLVLGLGTIHCMTRDQPLIE